MAEVSEKTDIAGDGAKQKTYGFLGVMRNGEGFDHDIAQFKSGAGAKDPALKRNFTLELNGIFGRPIAIDRNAQFLA
jgi:hypothetical protein